MSKPADDPDAHRAPAMSTVAGDNLVRLAPPPQVAHAAGDTPDHRGLTPVAGIHALLAADAVGDDDRTPRDIEDPFRLTPSQLFGTLLEPVSVCSADGEVLYRNPAHQARYPDPTPPSSQAVRRARAEAPTVEPSARSETPVRQLQAAGETRFVRDDVRWIQARDGGTPIAVVFEPDVTASVAKDMCDALRTRLTPAAQRGGSSADIARELLDFLEPLRHGMVARIWLYGLNGVPGWTCASSSRAVHPELREPWASTHRRASFLPPPDGGSEAVLHDGPVSVTPDLAGVAGAGGAVSLIAMAVWDEDRPAACVEVFTAGPVSLDSPLRKGVALSAELLAIAARSQRLERTVRNRAQKCPVTGFRNKQLLDEEIASALARRSDIALLLVVMPTYQRVVDTRSLQTSQGLLREIAARFENVVRSTDQIAHLGDGNFAILAHRPEGARGADVIAAKIQKHVAGGVTVEGVEFTVPLHVCVVVPPHDGRDVAELWENLNATRTRALSESTDNQDNRRVWFFDRETGRRAAERAIALDGIARSLEQYTLEAHFQPQYRFDPSGQGRHVLVGFESLARWPNAPPSMSNDDIIKAVGELGKLDMLNDYMLRAAALFLRDWRTRGNPPVVVSVNVSPGEFVRPKFVSVVAEVCGSYGVAPGALEIEITEGTSFGELGRVAATMMQLDGLGVRVALDDFGTGHANLNVLQVLPFPRVKFDKSFLRAITGSSRDRNFLRWALSMSEFLDCEVVAEGVETTEQLDFVSSTRGIIIQGWGFSKAMPGDAALDTPQIGTFKPFVPAPK